MMIENKLAGRAFEYQINDHHVRVEFETEDRLILKYFAPPEKAGFAEAQTLQRREIAKDVSLVTWTEPDGAHVIDVFDLDNMVLHSNFVRADGDRFFVRADIREM